MLVGARLDDLAVEKAFPRGETEPGRQFEITGNPVDARMCDVALAVGQGPRRAGD